MYAASSADFDLKQFVEHLRATKPPYTCPFEKCKGGVYKSLRGIERHVDKEHAAPPPHAPDVDDDDDGRQTPSRPDTLNVSTASSGCAAETGGAAARSQQRTVDIDVGGRVCRLNVMQPLEVAWVRSADLPPESRAAAVLKKYRDESVGSGVTLPKAEFRSVAVTKRAPFGPMPADYIDFKAKSADEMEAEIEYDMDEEDNAWLLIINGRRRADALPAVPEETFEFVMDRLEKESHFQHSQAKRAFHMDDDAVCCVCQDGECHNTNVILFCDMCNLAVHQECYGVPYIPEGQWLCRRCQLSPSRPLQCCLCPNSGGAFKQTSDGRWAHVVCAIWVPEVHFANTVFLEPIEGLDAIPDARSSKLRCIVCKKKQAGACIQCHKPSCYTAFHVTCAQSAGLYMRVVANQKSSPSSSTVRKYVYCDLHAPVESADDDTEQDVSMTVACTPRLKVDSKAMQARKELSKEKIRKARRLLAQKRNSAPSVSIPVIPRERLEAIAEQVHVGAKERFMPRVVAYWTLKRESRQVVSRSARLPVCVLPAFHRTKSLAAAAGGGDESLRTDMSSWRTVRQQVEKIRLLCELIRKRERLKSEYANVVSDMVDAALKPVSALMVELVDRLVTKDRANVFTQPVTDKDVPGYSSVIEQPMDLQTMRAKAAAEQYRSLAELRADFKLMVDNCVDFNRNNDYFWKYGNRMRRIGGKVLSAGRKEYDALKQSTGKASVDVSRVALLSDAELQQALDTAGAFCVSGDAPLLGTPPSVARLSAGRNSRAKAPLDPSSVFEWSAGTDDLASPVELPKPAPTLTAAESRKRKRSEKTDAATRPPKKRKGDAAQLAITKFFGVSQPPESPSPGSVNRRTAVLHSNKKPKGELSASSSRSDLFSIFRNTDPLSPAGFMSDGATTEAATTTDDETVATPSSARRKRGGGRKRRVGPKAQTAAAPSVDDVSLDAFTHLDMVWAEHSNIPPRSSKQKQCWLPALVIEPRKVASGAPMAAGDASAVTPPPKAILAQQPPFAADDPHYLVRYFDTDMSWDWRPRRKLDHFGLMTDKDNEHLDRPKRQSDRKLVECAVDRAHFHRYKLTGETPEGGFAEKMDEMRRQEAELDQDEDEM